MSSVILSCPFCHQKGDYRDAPPNSTVRCHECDSMFRVPANAFAKHKPGTVLTGEHETKRGPWLKVVLIVVLVGVVGGGGWWVWKTLYSAPVTEVEDPYGPQVKYPVTDPAGVLERFLLCWKDVGDPKKHMDPDAVLRYCRSCDRAKLKEGTDIARKDFEAKLNSKIGKWIFIELPVIKGQETGGEQGVVTFQVIVASAQDRDSKTDYKGLMRVRVVQDDTPNGKEWGVDLDSAVPIWE